VYGIAWKRSPKSISAFIKKIAPAILGLLLACAIISPAFASVSADETTIPRSSGTLAQDDPELISCLKTHIAYVGQTQDARMNGVISYVDTISGGLGSGNLRDIREDYLAVASSIPVMQTADDIAQARVELQRQSRLFSEETKTQMVMFNGSTDTMREQASTSIQAMEDSITSIKDSLWLAKETARLTVFNQESQQRAEVIRTLSNQGVDISKAANISREIDAHRDDLQKALTAKSTTALMTTNSGLKSLNREFRVTVEGYQTNLQIEMKCAAILAMK
jgi:hypothetical protein